MSNSDNMRKLQKFSDNTYNSDEDLSDEDQQKIKDKESLGQYNTADAMRKEAWSKAGMYPKLKRMVKSAYGGDTQGDNN